jgi:rhodanese-related sulfurtransferase
MIDQVHPRDLAHWLETVAPHGRPLVLDVREPHEWQMASVKADGFEMQAIPMRAVPVRMNELDASPPTSPACATTAGAACRSPRSSSTTVFPTWPNIAGGIDAWSREVDLPCPATEPHHPYCPTFFPENPMKLPRPLPLAFALATLFGGSAQAQNLVQMYEAARGYDAGYQSAKAQYEASIAKADQATAGHPAHGEHRRRLLPDPVQQQDGQRNIVIDNSFRNGKRVISASQPLYRPANLATYEQGRKQVDIAKAQLDAVEQDLIVRVSTAYFDVLSAQDNLFLIREQKKAVAEQFESAKRNFEVGTATITDSREAESL